MTKAAIRNLTSHRQSEIWQHKASGGLFMIIAESSFSEERDAHLTVYKSLFDGAVAECPPEDFFNGQFRNLAVDEVADCSPKEEPRKSRWLNNDGPSFQTRVFYWVKICFGGQGAYDRTARAHRFIEEALELYQAEGHTKEDALALVEYVFDRPIGQSVQEVGGVMLTLAALCESRGIDMDGAGNQELRRVWKNIKKIQAKDATKSKESPLPGVSCAEGYDK